MRPTFLSVILSTVCLACPATEPVETATADATAEDTGSHDLHPDGAAVIDSDAPTGDEGLDDDVALPECAPNVGARPNRRSEHAGVFDSTGNQIIVFGGSEAIPVDCNPPSSTAENDTWIYDVRCDVWRKLEQNGPAGRARHMAAFDSVRRQMLVFGGRVSTGGGNYQLFNDLWALDLETEQWSELPATSRPQPRVNGALVFDPESDRLVLFGGNTASSAFPYEPQNDLWVYDFATQDWSQVAGVGSAPAPRLFAGAAWDSKRSRLVIFGGADNSSFTTAQYFGDLWALDMTATPPTWTELHPSQSGGPQGRFWPGLVFHPALDRYVLFGGHDDGVLGNRNDVWAFFAEPGQWVQIAAGDSFNKPARGTCDFPPDFTNIATDVPERRNAHVMVASDTALFVAGGKTDCGAADDLVTMDLDTHAWTDLTFATVGLSCLRKGGQNCSDLCL